MTAAATTLRVDAIDAVLPQTQCRQCGFDGCLPYARAISTGAADIDRCPPGGDEGILKLSAITGRPRLPLDTRRGTTKPLVLAVIDEAACIGCTLCIQACPVDAIIGAAKRMHVVIADLCSGCELCVAPCPVDCITLEPAGRTWGEEDAAAARLRHRARGARLERLANGPDHPPIAADPATARRRAIVDAAVTRAAALAARRHSARPASR